MIKPLSVQIYASATSFRSYQSGIYNDPTCPTEHNHATNVVGRGIDAATGSDYWIMRNSWGTGWGENGYIKMLV